MRPDLTSSTFLNFWFKSQDILGIGGKVLPIFVLERIIYEGHVGCNDVILLSNMFNRYFWLKSLWCKGKSFLWLCLLIPIEHNNCWWLIINWKNFGFYLLLSNIRQSSLALKLKLSLLPSCRSLLSTASLPNRAYVKYIASSANENAPSETPDQVAVSNRLPRSLLSVGAYLHSYSVQIYLGRVYQHTRWLNFNI